MFKYAKAVEAMMSNENFDLTGKLLVSMPGMGDPRFAQTVIYICSHSDEGAMGLIINKPKRNVSWKDVIEQIEDVPNQAAGEPLVRRGGPVETGRGFVLHSDDYRSALKTLDVADGIALTATRDILEEISAGKGPKKAMLMLGYSGWGKDQLEGEIAQNGWLTCDASMALVFDLEDAQKWQAAISSLGIDPLGLSATAGRA